MIRLDDCFAALHRRGRKALIPFIVAGDGGLALTQELIPALQDAGADIIEVGIPFSDPLADGPVIQEASHRALEAGTTPHKIIEALERVKDRLRVPLVFLTYWNPVIQFGAKNPPEPQSFLKACSQAGVGGVIVPDLSVEEGAAFARDARKSGIDAVFLAAPTSTPKRLQAIAKLSRGFIYYVSLTGTTGARAQLPPELENGIRHLKRITKTPVCVGFGISSPEQVRRVAQAADGVIVGSALVRTIAQAPASEKVKAAADFVRSLSQAL